MSVVIFTHPQFLNEYATPAAFPTEFVAATNEEALAALAAALNDTAFFADRPADLLVEGRFIFDRLDDTSTEDFAIAFAPTPSLR